jgi:hypothetical protein
MDLRAISGVLFLVMVALVVFTMIRGEGDRHKCRYSLVKLTGSA